MLVTPVRFLDWEDLLKKGKAAHSSILGLPWWLSWKESICNAGNLGSIPGLGRSPGEGKGHPLQYPGLENSMDCMVHKVAKSWTRLSNFHFYFPYGLKQRIAGQLREEAGHSPQTTYFFIPKVRRPPQPHILRKAPWRSKVSGAKARPLRRLFGNIHLG